LVFSLPFGNYLRAPVKWHHLTEFCFAVLAGFGIEFVIRRFSKSEALVRIVKIAALVLVFVGTADLARNAKFYCAPLNISEVRKQNAGMQMTLARQIDLQNPQVREMMRAKKLVLFSNANRDPILLGVINPVQKNCDPFPPLSSYAWLSVLSMVGTIAVGAYAVKKS
jgi:hypothetical protein